MKYIGVDVGGTKISAALVDEKGKVLKNHTTQTQANASKEIVLNNIVKAISKIDDKTVKIIGVGVPGVPDKSGKIVFIPNIKSLQNKNIKKYLQEKIKKKAIIENDSNCFALAEHEFGVGKNKQNMVGLILGTGVGCGIIIHNKMYKGHDGFAGEVGHMKIRLHNKESEFEDLLSGRGFLKKYIDAGGKPTVIEKLNKNSKEFKTAYKEWLDELEILIRNIIKMFSPQIIVVGGGLSNFNFYKEMNKRIQKTNTKCKIVKNSLGPDAGKIGAAMLTK